MRSNDIKSVDEIRAMMQKAIKESDTKGFYDSVELMAESIKENIMEDYETSMNEMKQEFDSRILAARGVRQLTSEEHDYYQKLTEAMKSRNPKQAINNMDVVMPKTIIDSVMDNLRTNHPLLSKINFVPAAGAIEMVMNTSGHQEATWGPLTSKIVEEATAGFKKISTNLMKLSAFVMVCKAMLDLGPVWMDRFVRENLYEMMANGMEVGIVTGDGKDKPIGMTRQNGAEVSVVGGAYPEKKAVKVNDLGVATVGNLISLLAVDENGKPRIVSDLILVVNPQDYYQKIMPATTAQATDGHYVNNVLPYPMDVIPSFALPRGKAVFGIASRYFAAAGTAKEGQIEYSDDYRFLEDERAYIIKAYANGMPKDDNSFLVLDISGMKQKIQQIQTVPAPEASADADLASLKLGKLSLSPEFGASTTSYTAATKTATNTIMAVPADMSAYVKITVGDTEIDNGAAAKWQEGSNTVTVHVTAPDGSTTKDYTVTVTKS